LKKFEYAKKDYKITSKHQVWQEGFFPKEILALEALNQKLEYIHMNPVMKGFVEFPEDWIYSSAGDYLLNRKGLIDLDLEF
jgi:putative transposase